MDKSHPCIVCGLVLKSRSLLEAHRKAKHGSAVQVQVIFLKLLEKQEQTLSIRTSVKVFISIDLIHKSDIFDLNPPLNQGTFNENLYLHYVRNS